MKPFVAKHVLHRRCPCALGLAAALALAGCAPMAPVQHTGGEQAAPPPSAPASKPQPPPLKPDTSLALARPAPPVAAPPPPPPEAPRGPPAAHSLPFEPGVALVDVRFADALRQIAEHLKGDPAAWAVLEAHSDEPGSREYNMALSQRRAEEVQRALVALGVPEQRIIISNYGEERRRAKGAARRVDVHYRYSKR